MSVERILILFLVLGIVKLVIDFYVSVLIARNYKKSSDNFAAFDVSIEKWKTKFECDLNAHLKEMQPEHVDKLIALEKQRTLSSKEAVKSWKLTAEAQQLEKENYKIRYGVDNGKK